LHICARRAQTIPAPIALKIYQDAHFSAFFLKYASRTSVLLSSQKWRLFQVLFYDFVKIAHISCTHFTFHASQCHSSVHGLLSHNTHTAI
jgi:hypothetical protein